MAVNTQKLLPASKSSALAVRTSKIKVGGGQLAKSSGGGLSKEILQMKVKVLKLQGEFDKNKKLNQKEQETKRKNEEKEKKSKREKKLEKKDGKGFELPNVVSRLPGGSIVDAIKRYIGFTFLGWLVGKYDVLMPQLEKFMSVAKPVFEGLVFTTEAILKGVYGFVEAGYKAYDSVSATIKQIGGEDAEKTFHDFSSHLNKLLNGTLMAAMLIASTSPGGKPGKPGKPGRMPGGGYSKPNQRLQSYLGRNDQTKLIERRYGNDAARMYEARRAQGGSHARALADVRGRFQPTSSPLGSLGGTNRGSGVFNRGLAKAPQRAATKMFGKAAGKTVSKLGGRIPIVGPLIDFGIRTLIYKEPLGKAAAGAVGMGVGQALGGWLGGAIGGIVGSVVPFVGTMLVGAAGATIGSLIGGVIGDMLGAALYDFVAGSSDNKKPQGKSRGGTISSSNRRPRRRVATQITREKIRPQNTSPGKDIGGRKKIEEFYGKEKVTEGTGKLFDNEETRGQLVVEKLEKISNDVKKLPLDWVASIGGAFIDMTMGQKPSKRLASDVGKSFGDFIESIINSEITLTANQITKSLTGMASGGVVGEGQQAKGQISKKVSGDMERQLQTIFDSAYSIASSGIKKGFFETEESVKKPSSSTPSDGGIYGGGGRRPGVIDISDIDADTPEEKAFIATIRMLEGTASKDGYNTFFGGSQYGGDLSSKTVNQVKMLQEKFLAEGRGNFSGGRSAAVGAGQFLYPEQIVSEMGMDPSKVKFTPELQNKMILYLARKKRGIDVSKPLSTSDIEVLGREWASLTPALGQTGRTAAESLDTYNQFLKEAREKEGQLQIKTKGGIRPSQGNVTEGYGVVSAVHPNPHTGIDYGYDIGTPVSLIKGGKVIEASVGYNGGFGNFVVIQHPDGTYSQYNHLGDIKVKKGQTLTIKSGQKAPIIGTVGSTGRSTGPHLDFKMGSGWNGGTLTGIVDPTKRVDDFFRFGADVTLEEIKSKPAKREFDIIIPLDHVPPNLRGKFPDKNDGKTFEGSKSLGADGREREHQDLIANYMSGEFKKLGRTVRVVKPEDFRSYEEYDNFIVKQSKAGSTVLPLHLDAPRSAGGKGFLARIQKDDLLDKKLADAATPVLEKWSGIFKTPSGFAGVDTESNRTVRLSGNAPGALLELGSLVELEKKFGKNFTSNSQYQKFMSELAAAVSSTIVKQQPSPVDKKKETKPTLQDVYRQSMPSSKSYDVTGVMRAQTIAAQKAKKDKEIWDARPWYDKFGWFGGAAAVKKQGGGAVLSSSQPQSSYSSLNKSGTLKEDTSDQQVIVMYQREIVMS